MTTNLDVTLTLAEYMRRMTSADASEWLPPPSETVVLYEDIRIDHAGYYNPKQCTGYAVHPAGLVKDEMLLCCGDEEVTVSLLTY